MDEREKLVYTEHLKTILLTYLLISKLKLR
jgi:hypothetical protein